MKRIGFAALAGANLQSACVLAMYGHRGYAAGCFALALVMLVFAALGAK